MRVWVDADYVIECRVCKKEARVKVRPQDLSDGEGFAKIWKARGVWLFKKQGWVEKELGTYCADCACGIPYKEARRINDNDES